MRSNQSSSACAVRVLRVVELDLVLLGAVFEAKSLGAQVGDFQPGFEGTLEVVQLFGQVENFLRCRRRAS